MKKVLFWALAILSPVFCLSGCSPKTPPIKTPLITPSVPVQDPPAPPSAVVQPTPDDEDFVKLQRYLPDAVTDLRYATQNNFTDQKIYDFSDVYLRYGTVKKLMAVQDALKQKGLYLKVWDGFRPPAAQFKLWDICPDPTYVSDPNKGFSSHSRGNTVDITLVYADGTEMVMPTGFDDFSKLADRDYSDCTPESASNARFLEQLMIEHGFKPYFGEWWHFSDKQSYSVEKSFEPTESICCYANASLDLHTKPSTNSDVIISIPNGQPFQVTATHGDFLLVEYGSLFGYVLQKDLRP